MVEFQTIADSPGPHAALALRSRLAGLRVMSAALRLHGLASKAGFDPNQPRVPRGHSDGGQWTRTGGSDEGRVLSDATSDNFWKPGTRVAQNESGNELPKVPEKRPPTAKARNTIIKSVANWLAMQAAMGTKKRIQAIAKVAQLAGWIDYARPYIVAFGDPPKSLEELQQAVSAPAKGYDIHHIVEKTSAAQDGFPRELIEASENRVRIPTLKHWVITAWYMTKNRKYGGLSPREYLRGKDWAERLKVGREALIKFGVLKP